MFCCGKSKLKLENIHKQTLREVCNKYEKNYKYLFADHDEICIDQKYLQFLVTETFKSTNKFTVHVLLFREPRDSLHLRWGSVVMLPGTNTTKYGINSLNV